MLEDARAGTLNAPVTEATAAWLAERAPGLVTWEGWRAIDAHETALGSPEGRPRVKLVRVAHMLEIAVGA